MADERRFRVAVEITLVEETSSPSFFEGGPDEVHGIQAVKRLQTDLMAEGSAEWKFDALIADLTEGVTLTRPVFRDDWSGK